MLGTPPPPPLDQVQCLLVDRLLICTSSVVLRIILFSIDQLNPAIVYFINLLIFAGVPMPKPSNQVATI